MTANAIVLCDVDDIGEGTSKSFTVGTVNLFAIKKSGQIYLYQNRCPHAGLPLNWLPDQFLDRDGELILCGSHGALFQIETGRCVAGPCAGRHLRAVDFTINADNQLQITPPVIT